MRGETVYAAKGRRRFYRRAGAQPLALRRVRAGMKLRRVCADMILPCPKDRHRMAETAPLASRGGAVIEASRARSCRLAGGAILLRIIDK